jgi:hypothetical protein
MTVENPNVKNMYGGNGVTTVFPFTFVLNAEDVNNVVVTLTNEHGKETATTDFTLSLNDKVVRYPKSSAQPLPRGWKITIQRKIPYTQTLNLISQGPFFAEDIEAQFDRQEMQIQQLAEIVERTVRVSISSDVDPADLIAKIFQTGVDVSAQLLAAQQSASDAAGSEANAKHSEDAAREMAERMNTVLASAADEIKQKLSTEYVPQTQASREHQELRTAISNAGIAILGKLDKTEQAADSRKLGGQSLQWILEQINAKAGEVTNHLYRHIGGYETPTITALINWELMATENNGVDARNLRNAESGITACGGDNTSKSGYGKSCILLKQVYTDFDKILVLGCDDACTVCTRRVFDKWELDLMFANSFIFNIVDDNGSIWRIFGGKKGTYTGELSSGKVWRTHSQGCGIIEIYGIKY